MSAECNTCGSDIVYPAGTWPLGECPVCAPKNRAEQRDEWLRRQLDGCIEYAEAIDHHRSTFTSRALLGDLRTARDALTTAPELVSDSDAPVSGSGGRGGAG